MPSNLAAKASRERCRGPLTALALVLTCQCGVGQSQMEVRSEAGATLIVRGIWNPTRIGNRRKRFPFLSMFATRVRQAPKETLQVTLHTCAALEFVFGMSSVAMAPPQNDLLFLCWRCLRLTSDWKWIHAADSCLERTTSWLCTRVA